MKLRESETEKLPMIDEGENNSDKILMKSGKQLQINNDSKLNGQS